jgi:alkanesulfonate monooxygenase SsuD/methylene tetrahydromethanopterin reductase-like flavin-dependent oxidoreductase (luciferase family)
LIAEFGTGWLPTWTIPRTYEELLPRLEERMMGRGRDMDESFTVAKECYTCIHESAAQAIEASARTMSTFASGFTVMDETTARESALVGAPADVIAATQRFVDVGVTYFEMKFVSRGMQELELQLELFAKEVIPEFRGP